MPGHICSYSPHTPWQGTQTGFKNQLLFERFGINYNDLLPQFKKVGLLICP